MPAIDRARLSPNPLFSFLKRQGPLLSPEEEVRLGQAAHQGCRRARNELVERNMRLVIDLVKRLGYRDENELIDRIQEGSIGLIRAAEKFDPARGFRFSTYATWWIRQAITRDRDGKQPVHVPLAVVSELRSAEVALTESLGRTPTVDEIADHVDMTASDVAAARAAMRPLSLDVPVGEDGDSTLGDLLGDDRGDDPAALCELASTQQEVEQLLMRLTRKERAVIRLRFGFETGTPEPFSVVCRAMGIDMRDARLLESQALRVLREHAADDEQPPSRPAADLPAAIASTLRGSFAAVAVVS